MNSIKATARRAGVLYFLLMIAGLVGEFLFPTFTVPGDAAATAGNIAEAELTYRIGILISFSTLVLFIFLVAGLYKLFKDVDRSHALLMVLLASVGIAVALADVLIKFAPLVLLGEAGALSAFTKPQLDALVLGALRLQASGSAIVTGFWGLWLLPFGVLVIKSGFIPRILGFLLLIAGVGYLVTSVTSIALPAYQHIVSQVMMPIYFGEVPIIFWLLIKGAREQSPEAQP
jgi:hypothetical protein